MTRFASVVCSGAAQFSCDVTYPFADTTKTDLSSRQRSVLSAQVPQYRSGTLRRRTLSASVAPERSKHTRTITVRIISPREKHKFNPDLMMFSSRDHVVTAAF